MAPSKMHHQGQCLRCVSLRCLIRNTRTFKVRAHRSEWIVLAKDVNSIPESFHAEQSRELLSRSPVHSANNLSLDKDGESFI